MVLLTALAGLALVGCGGGTLSKSEYKKKVIEIGQQFKNSAAGIRERLQSASDRDSKIKALDDVKGQFSDLADKLDALNPPSSIKPAQDKVVSALRKEASEISDLTDAARKNDNTKGVAALTALRANNAELAADFQELKSKSGA
jgi:gas vesicle protein